MPGVEAKPAAAPPEEEEMDDEPDEVSWNLGFVEEPESPQLLLRHRFPSKVGGRPAWLDPVRLPSRAQLTCSASGKPLDFLLQLYAPVDANPVNAFHRSLFLFISPEGGRLTEPGSVRLLRCQLPRANPYYPPQPPKEKDRYPPALKESDLAASRSLDPWRSVDHERPAASSTSSSSPASGSKSSKGKKAAPATASSTPTAASAGAAEGGKAGEAAGPGSKAVGSWPPQRPTTHGPGGLYPEYELVVEPEDDYKDEEEDDEDGSSGEDEDAESSGSGSEAGGAGGGAKAAGQGQGRAAVHGKGVAAEVREALAAYRSRVAAEGELDEEELPPDVVAALEAGAAPEQRAFADFQARVSLAPEQVVRYCAQDGAQPLWPSAHGRPGPGDIPPCPNCGAPRKFEFQVLPQLLHYLRLDEEDPACPDWSTLVAYTCSASCDPRVGGTGVSEPQGAPGESTGQGGAGGEGGGAYLEEFVWVQGPAGPEEGGMEGVAEGEEEGEEDEDG